jgi:hypothetical protein
MPEDDQKFDAALAGFFHCESRDDSAKLLCPDGEVLAAYHERALLPDELKRIAVHIAGCAHCAQVLALLESTETLPFQTAQNVAPEIAVIPQTSQGSTVVEIGRRAPTSQWKWRWIAPAAAIAAGVLLWIGYREMRPAQPGVQVAENRRETEMPKSQAAPVPAVAEEKPQDHQEARQKKSKSGRAVSGYVGVVPKNSQLKEKVLQDVERNRLEKSEVEDNVRADQDANQTASNYATEATPAPAFPAPAPPARAAPKLPITSTDELTQTTRSANRVITAASAETNSTLFVARGPNAMWRVGVGGSIEFSSTGGRQWQRQTSGVSADLVSGFAPQPNICWVVGRAGTILLTTDSGNTWQKIISPTTADLGGVHASDALHATIWELSTWKKFETADGGQSWEPVAGQ